MHPFVALGNRYQTFEQMNILGCRTRTPNTGTKDKESPHSCSTPHGARNRQNGYRYSASRGGLLEETSAVGKPWVFLLSKANTYPIFLSIACVIDGALKEPCPSVSVSRT